MRPRRSPCFLELAYFTVSLRDKSISLVTGYHDFSPVAPPTAPRARPLSRLTNGVNSPSNRLPLPPRISEGSEGYPSWLPERPPPPDPGSTIHSCNGQSTPGLTPVDSPFSVGRKPTYIPFVPSAFRTPLSLVRINARSRNTRSSATHCALESGPVRDDCCQWGEPNGGVCCGPCARPVPNSIQMVSIQNTCETLLAKLYFYLFPFNFFTFYHIPLQTFF